MTSTKCMMLVVDRPTTRISTISHCCYFKFEFLLWVWLVKIETVFLRCSSTVQTHDSYANKHQSLSSPLSSRTECCDPALWRHTRVLWHWYKYSGIVSKDMMLDLHLQIDVTSILTSQYRPWITISDNLQYTILIMLHKYSANLKKIRSPHAQEKQQRVTDNKLVQNKGQWIEGYATFDRHCLQGALKSMSVRDGGAYEKQRLPNPS